MSISKGQILDLALNMRQFQKEKHRRSMTVSDSHTVVIRFQLPRSSKVLL